MIISCDPDYHRLFLIPEIDLRSNQDQLSPCEGAELEGLADEVAAEAWFWSYMALKAAKWSR